VVKDDEDFERIMHEKKYNMRDKRIDKTKRAGEPLSVVYSIKLTQSQRIALARLGPQWMRNQVERSAEFCSLGTDNTGQVRLGRLPAVTGPTGSN
jgi:hypothetical protein